MKMFYSSWITLLVVVAMLTACAPAATAVPATETVETATGSEVQTEAPVQNVGTFKIAVLRKACSPNTASSSSLCPLRPRPSVTSCWPRGKPTAQSTRRCL
jgi:hypothetical protein